MATDHRTGKVKYATAHDLRRSFGERWSTRLMPQTLMQLMRHESIDTTMRYYVGRNANTTADAVWEAYERSEKGTVLGTVDQNVPVEESAVEDVNPVAARSIREEAPVGVGPTMADLQSAALATWLRRHIQTAHSH